MFFKYSRATFVLLFLFVNSVSPCIAGNKVWIIKQVENRKSIRTVCVNRDGLKITAGRYILLSKAPDWKMYYLNGSTKTFCKTDNQAGSDWLRAIPLKLKVVEGEKEIAGLKVKTLRAESEKLIVNESCEIPLVPGEVEVLRRMYLQAPISGIPLEIIRADKKLLRTDWCIEKKLTDKDRVYFFSVPSGYSEVATRDELKKGKPLLRTNRYRGMNKPAAR